MNASNLAQEIWGTFWDYGRVILILLCGLSWSWFIGRRRAKGEGADAWAGLMLIGICTVGTFCLFSFLNIEMGNIRQLGRLKPMWAIFSAASLAFLIACVAFVAHGQLGAAKDEMNLSILDQSTVLPVWFNAKRQSFFLLTSVTLVGVSVWWLWSIARHSAAQ